MYACVLAGGRGERLWPLSTSSRPKQLGDLTGEGSMLRLTVSRLTPEIAPDRVVVITSEDLAAAVRAEIPEVPPENVIGEPVGKNSAPAAALAARWVARRDPDGVILVAPADHVLSREPFLDAFREAATEASRSDVLVTFGIQPTRPETGYGYIEIGDRVRGRLHLAVAFHEKPDLERARAYLASGRFRWNSGLFVWRAGTVLDAFAAHLPEVFALSGEVSFTAAGAPERASLARFYEHAPSISIDYGLMERAANVVVSVAPFPWCDVGSWSALADVSALDPAGNVRRGPVLALECERSILYSDGGPIAVLGLEDVVVVRVGEVTMVCPRARAGEVRELVQAARRDAAWKPYV